jgi:hypothetical protein
MDADYLDNVGGTGSNLLGAVDLSRLFLQQVVGYL